jgi:hypothetical protein
VFGTHLETGREDRGTLHHIGQFAHVAGPRVSQQRGLRARRQGRPRVVPAQQFAGQHQHILRPLAQRRAPPAGTR